MIRFLASVACVFVLWAPSVADAQQRPGQRNSRQVSSRRAPSRPVRQVRPASHYVQEEVAVEAVPQGTVAAEPAEVVMHGDYEVASSGCTSCDGGGCGSCDVGPATCGTCSAPRGLCICMPAHGWVHAEYLNWHQSGMNLPPLVTTSAAGTARAQAGVLGQSGTSILYGNDDVLDDDFSGFRIRFGWWLANMPGWGIEGEYTGLGRETESFSQQSSGTPILARPFFKVLTGAEDAE